MLVVLVACGDNAKGPPIDAAIDAALVDALACSSKAECGSNFCCLGCSPGGACAPPYCGPAGTFCAIALCDPTAGPCEKPFGGTGTCTYGTVGLYTPLYWTCQ